MVMTFANGLAIICDESAESARECVNPARCAKNAAAFCWQLKEAHQFGSGF
jgi:hypothetical protein